MARVVYLHIGAPKTGSTFLQAVLRKNKALLETNGVYVPADSWRPSLDLRGAVFQEHEDPKVPGAWAGLVHRLADWPGTAIVSHESFASCDPEHVERLAEELSFARLHVICTARDFVRQIPAVWQEGLKNRRINSMQEWLDWQLSFPVEERFAQHGFWRSQHTASLLERWSVHVPEERIHLVTVPKSGKAEADSGRAELWQRFAVAAGLEPAAYDVDVIAENASMGVTGAAVLRRLNARLVELEVSWPVYQASVKAVTAKFLRPLDDDDKIVIPAAHWGWAVAVAEEIVAQLRVRAYDVVGDLADLSPDPPPVGALDPDSVDIEAQLDRAIRVLADTTLWVGNRRLNPPPRRRREPRVDAAPVAPVAATASAASPAPAEGARTTVPAEPAIRNGHGWSVRRLLSRFQR